MKYSPWTALLGFSTFACSSNPSTTPAVPADPAAEIASIAADYWEALMERAPTWATYLGDYRWNDRLEDLSPAGRAAWRGTIERFRTRLRAVEPSGLDEESYITLLILRRTFDNQIESELHRFWEYEVDQMYGPQVRFLEIINTHPLDTREHIEQLAMRYEAFGPYLDQYMANLREGLASGRIAFRVAVERVIRQLNGIVETPAGESPLLDPQKLAQAPADVRERMTRAVREVVYPAFTRYRTFLETEYLDRARTVPGVHAIRDGRDAYAFLVRDHTTLDLTPEVLHQRGLDELEALRAQMLEIARRRGHTGDLRSFLDAIRDDPTNYYATRQELLDGFTALVARIDEQLPRLFLRQPRTPCVCVPIEEYREADAPAAYYYSPDEGLTRPGRFYVNTYRPETRPKYNMVALAAHEAVPGHHFQIAFAMERRDLPTIRRHADSTAFIEGWAHYAELLADEIGMYENDLDRLGMLSEQAWRSCRLVVDTGLHQLGWSRDQAIQFMMENLPLSQHETEVEIDRYIIWPGQALAYATGRREFLELRARATSELGDAFDVREYHDVVLRHGALPLSVLRAVVDRWIAEKKQSSRAAQDPLRLERHVSAPPSQVFEAFLAPGTWLGAADARVEPRIGGAYEIFWNPADRRVDSTLGCRIVDIAAPGRLRFQWRGPAQYADVMDEPGSTWVDVRIERDNGGSLVELVHEGWGPGERWSEAREWFRRAWTGGLDELVRALAR